MNWSLPRRSVVIRSDYGPRAPGSRYVHGSGCIVHDDLVLTAAHVVDGALRVEVRDSAGTGWHPAALGDALVGDPSPWSPVRRAGPDLALLRVPGVGHAPVMELARVDRDSPRHIVEGTHTLGYPDFATRAVIGEDGPSGRHVRVQAPAAGVLLLSTREDGLLDLQLTIDPRQPSEGSSWAGMSGAPVVVGGRLVGVVNEHAPRRGPSCLSITPITAIDPDPANPGWGFGVENPRNWWLALGQEDSEGLPSVPTVVEAEYQAVLRSIGEALHGRMPQLVGRLRELDEISRFALGPPGYMWYTGGPYAGKSALLYEAATSGVLPDDIAILCVMIQARTFYADERRFLSAVVPQLELLTKVEQRDPTPERFAWLWEQACRGPRPLLLVVDGLDEDQHPATMAPIIARLPRLLGRQGHVLVGSRPRPVQLSLLDPDHPARTCRQVELPPFLGSARLLERASHEIDAIASGPDADILGFITAAGGPLTINELAALASFPNTPVPSEKRRVREVVDRSKAARSLEPVGASSEPGYQFAHQTLMEGARANENLNDPHFRETIHAWADLWRDRGWPAQIGDGQGTPSYLLDSYPVTLADENARHTALACDCEWILTAVSTLGVDHVRSSLLAAPRRHGDAPDNRDLLGAQAPSLRPRREVPTGSAPPHPTRLDVARQLALQAFWTGQDSVAHEFVEVLRESGAIMPFWASRRESHPPGLNLGNPGASVRAMVGLPNHRLVTAGHDGRLLMWSGTEPDIDPLLLGREYGVQELVVVSENRIVSRGRQADGRLLVWDVTDPGTPSDLGQQSHVDALAVLPDGRIVSRGRYGDGRLLVWDSSQPGTSTEFGRDTQVSTMIVLSAGGVVTGGGDGRLLVWSPARPGTYFELGQHEEVSSLVALSRNRVISANSSGQLLVWDITSPGTSLELGHHHGASEMVVLSDDRVVTWGRYDGRILVWDCMHPQIPVELGNHDEISRVAALPDNRVVTAGRDARVLAWDLASPGVPSQIGHHAGVTSMLGLPEGRIVTASHTQLMVWSSVVISRRESSVYHSGIVRAVAILAGGRVVTGGDDGRLVAWSPSDPENPLILGDHRAISNMVVLSDDRIVTAGGEGRLLAWDLLRPGAPLELGQHSGISNMVTLSDDRLVTASRDGLLRVWDPTSHAAPIQFGRHNGVFKMIALSNDRVVTGSANRLIVWNPDSPGAPLSEWTGSPLVNLLAVASLDSRIIFATSYTRGAAACGIETWDPDTGQSAIRRALDNGQMAMSLSVLADGRVVMVDTGGQVELLDKEKSEDRTSTILDSLVATVATRGQLLALGTHEGVVLLEFPERVQAL